MKLSAAFFGAVLTGATALTGSPANAACPVSTTAADNVHAQLMTAVHDRKYAEAEQAYQKLLTYDAVCVTAQDHTYGGIAARKRGDIHNALLRFTTAGNKSAIADINKAYGVLRINASSTAPTPRFLTWTGVMITNGESSAVVDRTKAMIAGPNRVTGYLPVGTYSIKSGSVTLLTFEIKAGETLMLTYP